MINTPSEAPAITIFFPPARQNIRYTKKNILWCKVFSAGISFLSLFDTRYIGIINASDDTRQGSASYYAGTPFTVLGNVTFKF